MSRAKWIPFLVLALLTARADAQTIRTRPGFPNAGASGMLPGYRGPGDLAGFGPQSPSGVPSFPLGNLVGGGPQIGVPGIGLGFQGRGPLPGFPGNFQGGRPGQMLGGMPGQRGRYGFQGGRPGGFQGERPGQMPGDIQGRPGHLPGGMPEELGQPGFLGGFPGDFQGGQAPGANLPRAVPPRVAPPPLELPPPKSLVEAWKEKQQKHPEDNWPFIGPVIRLCREGPWWCVLLFVVLLIVGALAEFHREGENEKRPWSGQSHQVG
jgi:hypothetical protein